MIPSMSPSCTKCPKIEVSCLIPQIIRSDPLIRPGPVMGKSSGSYLSLSTPHLGIQSSWLQPLHAWRNFCWLSRPISLQLPQLAIQDSSSRPYLLEISQAESEAGKYAKKHVFFASFWEVRSSFVGLGLLFDRMDGWIYIQEFGE